MANILALGLLFSVTSSRKVESLSVLAAVLTWIKALPGCATTAAGASGARAAGAGALATETAASPKSATTKASRTKARRGRMGLPWLNWRGQMAGNDWIIGERC